MARILVIDDDKDIIQVIEFLAQQDGHEVLSAMDGNQGIEAAISARPDLIILDIMMPEKSGFAVNLLLLADLTTQNIPVIVLTAMDIDRGSFLTTKNVHRYMKKPFDPAMLQEQIQMVLNEKIRKAA